MRPVESLEAYRVAVDVAVLGCGLADDLIEARHFSMADQVCRAAMSVPANIAEGYALGTRPQLVKFFRTALGSNEELRTHAEVIRRGQLRIEIPTELLSAADRLSGLLVGLLKRYGARPES